MTVLAALDVGAPADAWRAAGFTVDDDDAIRVGHVALRVRAGERGITAWHLADAPPEVTPSVHPNRTVQLDHLVVFTDDPPRTTARYGTLGLDARRVRDVGNGRTQTFFRAGEVIIELVGPIPDVVGDRFWGLAFTVDDLDACVQLLGGAIGAPKDAVQPGRRIATLRHGTVGLDVPIAFMSK